MDFGYLFTSFNGRINRKPYWFGLIVLLGFLILLSIGTAFVASDFDRRIAAIFNLLVMLGLLYPGSAITIKRLHDRNRPTWWVALVFGPTVIGDITNVIGITGDPLNLNVLDYALSALSLIIAIWMFIELGCLRGTVGPNQYGPDPLEGRA